jgi:hypothetical protein
VKTVDLSRFPVNLFPSETCGIRSPQPNPAEKQERKEVCAGRPAQFREFGNFERLSSALRRISWAILHADGILGDEFAIYGVTEDTMENRRIQHYTTTAAGVLLA